MMWARLAAGMFAAGIVGGAATAQAAPLPPVIDAFPGSAVESVQYYYYDDDYDYAPPPPRRRVYRQPPAYGYYPPPPRYYGPPPGFVERRKEAIKDYRRAEKEIFKERVRAWNRTHGF